MCHWDHSNRFEAGAKTQATKYGFMTIVHYHHIPPTCRNLTAECNANCHCTTGFYDAVCDTNTMTTYFSPCHAGCWQHETVCSEQSL